MSPGGGTADPVTPQITVDQFGWLPRAGKVAILADPVKGQNAGQTYRPGRASRSVARPMAPSPIGERRSRGTGARSASWQETASGLRISATCGRRAPITSSIPSTGPLVLLPDREDVYGRSCETRCGSSITSGAAPRSPRSTAASGIIPAVIWEETRTAPRGTHREARRWAGRADLLGGWFDAGDLNKYVPYLEATLFDLLWAYELNPRAFGDDTNIPESGNGVPDLLDEVKWELDWLLKMQDTDGGFFNRVAGRSYDNGPAPPAAIRSRGSTPPRPPGRRPTPSASLAHAARVYARFDKAFPGYANRLARGRTTGLGLPRGPSRDGPGRWDRRRFEAGRHPGRKQPRRRSPCRVFAAAELFKTIGEPAFKAYVDRWAPDIAATAENGMHPFKDRKQVDPLNHLALTQALFVYATTKGANPAVTEPFKEALAHTAEAIRQAVGGPGRPLPGLSLRGPLLLGEQLGEGPVGPRPAHDHRRWG